MAGRVRDGGQPDPLEPINRPIFKFNDTVDKVAVRPAAEVYRKTVPAPLRGGVTNFMDNVSDAWSTVNLVLWGPRQGRDQ